MKTYEPEIETARRAPAVVCAVASRTQRLREAMAKLRAQKPETLSLHDVEQLVRDFIAPLPFEKDFLSGNMERVDSGISNFPL